ncbi:hypothetical protein [Aquimarina litoralis]|uniref:hypothetical protein n=1 Tax=Aquimarina litoralis TaxID=584605 RepID=UPI001C55DDEA|nr:hypothetical protein [Aquimarina litoralis]MBW1294814.1 hypothetical protein [Aquimarina litoralis]
MKFRGTIILCLTVLLVLFVSMASSTGPSYVHAEIKPISINEKGEILCKTRFTKNEMGAYSPMKIEYGFCVLTKDQIIEFKTKIVEPSPEDSYYEQIKFWDEVFQSDTNEKQLDEIKNSVLKNEYDFYSINIDSFKINKIMSISDFEKSKKISLKKVKQKGLHNANSKEYYSDKKIHLLYDFGDILILDNNNDIDDNGLELELGAEFDYYNPLTISNEQGKDISLGFDINKVTGILRIK